MSRTNLYLILDTFSNNLNSLCFRCHNITYLSVCFCEHISEAGVELLGQTCILCWLPALIISINCVSDAIT